MAWIIDDYPDCTHHVFLSHSSLDKPSLIRPVRDRLATRNVAAWIDMEDYTYGRPTRKALRDGLLTSRHVVFFVTEAMLKSLNGWCTMELAFSELIQSNFEKYGGETYLNYLLPLYFVPDSHRRLRRSVWQLPRDLGHFCPFGNAEQQAEWATAEIVAFLEREQQLANQWRKRIRKQPELHSELNYAGKKERVTRFQPAVIR